MSRDIPYDPTLQCEHCKAMGANDFMGDVLCVDCVQRGLVEQDNLKEQGRNENQARAV